MKTTEEVKVVRFELDKILANGTKIFKYLVDVNGKLEIRTMKSV